MTLGMNEYEIRPLQLKIIPETFEKKKPRRGDQIYL